VQRVLERLYRVEHVADVRAFVENADEGERELLLVREPEEGTLEMRLRPPPLGQREIDVSADRDLDPLCQLIEGVSHFVYLANRATACRETTQLELEVQAEVDKYVVLAAAIAGFDAARSAKLRARLYESVSFEHDADTDLGERYRMANAIARRYVWHLERAYVRTGRYRELAEELRRFFYLGQEEKLRMGMAA
jgi:hypothetical protein